MKLTICLVAVLAALCLASAHARQQSPPFNESLAYARLIAAHKLPTVTHGQCFGAHGAWLERDKADKQNGPYWFQKVSTEELARIASLPSACPAGGGGIHTTATRTHTGTFVPLSSQVQLH